MTFPSTLRLTFFLALLTIASSATVSAQQTSVDKQKSAHINLNNLHHIDLLQHMGGLSAERRKTKLTKEKEIWQAFITVYDWNNDSTTLVKKIPVQVLDSLMALIANPAPTIDYRLFKLEENLLISEMDFNSKYELSPDQRAVFIDSFRSPTALNAAIKKAFMPFPMDDEQTV